MESVITRSGNPFTKPLIVIVMMAIVLLGADDSCSCSQATWSGSS